MHTKMLGKEKNRGRSGYTKTIFVVLAVMVVAILALNLIYYLVPIYS
jgi:hypothetical protein